MKAENIIHGSVALLMKENINTDIIMPQTELVTSTKTNLARGIFARWRYLLDGSEDTTFALNKDKYRHAKILISGKNFGCGSSREHAIWGILEYGIQCIIAPSFAEIFKENALQNKLLLIEKEYEYLLPLIQDVEKSKDRYSLTIDLDRMEIIGNQSLRMEFDIPSRVKLHLLQAKDDVDITLDHLSTIDEFQKKDKKVRPWIYQNEL
jgi:3-isopropylmalate/(R)-2-methylmalate dehydratase small subunit